MKHSATIDNAIRLIYNAINMGAREHRARSSQEHAEDTAWVSLNASADHSRLRSNPERAAATADLLALRKLQRKIADRKSNPDYLLAADTVLLIAQTVDNIHSTGGFDNPAEATDSKIESILK